MQTSLGKKYPPSRLCPPHLRPCSPCRYWTSKKHASSSNMVASYAVSVRQANALPATSFGPRLAADALVVQLTVLPAEPVGDLHPQVNTPCQAHTVAVGGSLRIAIAQDKKNSSVGAAQFYTFSCLFGPTGPVQEGWATVRIRRLTHYGYRCVPPSGEGSRKGSSGRLVNRSFPKGYTPLSH